MDYYNSFSHPYGTVQNANSYQQSLNGYQPTYSQQQPSQTLIKQPIYSNEIETYNFSPANDTEFLEIATAKNANDVLNVINEHLEAVKVVYPKEYEAVLAKLKDL